MASTLDGPVLWQNISAQKLQKELKETEQLLADGPRSQEGLLEVNDPESAKATEANVQVPHSHSNRLAELIGLDHTANDLLLAQDVSSWMKISTNEHQNESFYSSPSSSSSTTTMAWEAELCQRLGEILRQHTPTRGNNNTMSLYEILYEQEFIPNSEYLRAILVLELRKGLRQVEYPATESCTRLLQENEQQKDNTADSTFAHISTAAKWIHRLQIEHDLVVAHVQGTTTVPYESVDDVVLELCRPFVERIRHHFVEHPQQHQPADRIDRLPEWLFSYIREHVFPQDQSKDGPWELVHYGLTPIVRPGLSVDFANEIIRLIQWVFAQRSLFRHAKLAGAHSQPIVLYNAIEQLLHFDDFMSDLTGNLAGRVLSLMDIYVAGDDELLHWWMDREREAIFDSLLHGKLLEARDGGDDWPDRISPRAELFCSILQSVRRKATVFSFSGPYLSHVAAPLCMHFLDAVHGSATNLKEALFQQRNLPTAQNLQSNVKEWVELINGMHRSSLLLIGGHEHNDDNDDGNPADGSRSSAHQDLQRFGKSLERLEHVFIEEFASMFVENMLLEKAHLASYLMRCSHLLASDTDGSSSGLMSPELADTQYLLNAFLEVVDERSVAGLSSSARDSIFYSSRALRDRVLTVVSEKFLEVALDWPGTTPDISYSGGQVFAADIDLLLGESLLPPTSMRLMDVAKCLSMPSSQLGVIGDALCGLAGQAPPLTEEMFAIDERVFEEAMSMISAKSLLFMHLSDFLSILNRRNDISHISAY